MRARPRSPGSPRRTKTTKPSRRATPFPPYASESIWSSSSSSRVTGGAGTRSRLTDAEQVEAGLEALDLHRRVAAALPLGPRQAHDQLALRLTARRERRLVGGLVAELLGDSQRCLVEVERSRDRGRGAEPREAEGEDRLAHLRAVAVTLVLAPEPRPRLELAARCELVAANVLPADGPPLEKDAEGERPLLRTPLLARAKVVLDRRVDELLTGAIRPGYAEGHLVGRMHAAIREACHLGDLLLRPEPQLQALRAQAQAEEDVNSRFPGDRSQVALLELGSRVRDLSPVNARR